MTKDHLPLLVCPKTKRPLELRITEIGEDNRVKSGFLLEPLSGSEYPIVNHIPRFVPSTNYANSFGFQWNTHLLTQQDEYAQVNLSEERFFKETKWNKDLKGELILEAGSGAGRFTKHAVSTGATVVSFDYSNAVEANYKVNGAHKNLLLVQADIYAMPFPEDFFDKAFCFGVLQHTPDPKKSFFSILSHIRPGGTVATDIYLKSWKSYFHVKPYFRAILGKSSAQRLYKFTTRYVDAIWPIARVCRKSRLSQKLISRFVADRSEQLPEASDAMLKEWAYLDTFDWFSPAYDFPQTRKQFEKWHKEAGLLNLEVQYGYNGVEARGTKHT